MVNDTDLCDCGGIGNQAVKYRHRIDTACFFVFVFVLLYFLGRVGLPLAHESPDGIGIRDTGLNYTYFASTSQPIRSIIVGTMQHVEGPLQYIFLNLYCWAVGDLFPLNPATMQLPNTFLAFMTCVLAFLIGKRFFSIRAGYCFTLAFALSPWLALTIRMPVYFNMLSCALHFSTFYLFAALIERPDSKVNRICAPASLAAYIVTGLDWPSYLLCLLIFILLSGKVRMVMRNPANVLPAFAVALLLLWTAILYFRLGWEGLHYSRFVYPFWRLGVDSGTRTWSGVWDNTVLPWGPQLLLAIAGIALYVLYERKHLSSAKVGTNLLDVMCVWLFIAAPPLFMSSRFVSYMYVVGMPTSLLAGLTLARISRPLLVSCVGIMALVQIYVVTDRQFSFVGDEKRRVLAAACFLIEERPDLLSEGKTYFATSWDMSASMTALTKGGHGAAAVQYARGRAASGTIMPIEWPVTKDGVGKPRRLEAFYDAYSKSQEILTDWIIIESEAVSESNVAKDFFRRLLKDPQICWIARFREKTGQEIVIGVVARHGPGVPLEQAPLKDVQSLSDRYEAKYDRFSFLKKNVQNCWTY